MNSGKNRAEKFATFTTSCQLEHIPVTVLDKARWCIADTLGCMILGASAESVTILRAYAAEEGCGNVSSLIGSKQRATAAVAALVNGTAAHAFDLDDVGEGGHASAVMLSAALAAGEDANASGADVLLAYCIGMEVGGKIDQVLMSDHGKHYARGWHNTATSSAAGAAACCARLYGLDTAQTVSAICNAANLSCGIRKSFGSMTKHINAGNAAYAGLMSAKLAKLGFISNPDMLEAPGGFFECFTDAYDDSAIDQIGIEWSLAKPRIQKLFPSCGFSHRGICAVLDHYQELPREVEKICRVTIELPDKESMPLTYDRPTTGIEGSFSAEYTIAAALIDGAVTLDSFTDEMVQRPKVQDLMKKMVRIPFPGNVYTGVETITFEMEDGQVYACTCKNFAGGFHRPLSQQQLHDKFLDCAAHGVHADTTESIFQMTVKFEHIEEICRLTGAISQAALF